MTVRPTDDPADALDATWLDAISAWLPGRRWFAGKQFPLQGLHAEAAVPLTLGGTREGDTVTLVVLRVSFDAAPDQRYAVPVAVVSAQRSGLTADDARVIAALDDDRLLVDAMALADTAAIVVGTAFRTGDHRGAGGVATGCPRRERLVAHPALVQPMSVEQSNSSVLVADAQIAKLVRRVEPGPNPDAELTAHLAHRFAHVPGLAATLELRLDDVDEPIDALIVHDAVANDGDLWSVLSGALHRELADGGTFDDRHDGLARLVGRRTAELHTALAAPVDHDAPAGTADRMRPVPFTQDWQDELLDALAGNLTATRHALAQQFEDAERPPVIDRAVAAPLLDGDAIAMLARFDRLRGHVVDAMRIRVHGDLHLGQILQRHDGAHDIVFIDFEGEPGVPIEHRLVKRSPLTDLAGLLRSFDYVGRHALRLAVEAGTVDADRFEELETARAHWTRRLGDALVEEYLIAIEPAHLVPADRADAQLLLDLSLLDKGLYEIRYELANRPEWVAAPVAAVTEMITS